MIRKSKEGTINAKEKEEMKKLLEKTKPILKKITKEEWIKSIREDRESM